MPIDRSIGEALTFSGQTEEERYGLSKTRGLDGAIQMEKNWTTWSSFDAAAMVQYGAGSVRLRISLTPRFVDSSGNAVNFFSAS